MKLTLTTLLTLGSLAVTGFAAGHATPPSRIDVKYFEPEKFTDVRSSFTGSEVDHTYLDELSTFLTQSTAARFGADARLTITFTDIDLAGDFEPWRDGRFADIRIVKPLYPARLKFSFVVTDATGAVLKSGERELREFSFTRLPGLAPDRLRFEKGLLDDWLREEFPRARS